MLRRTVWYTEPMSLLALGMCGPTAAMAADSDAQGILSGTLASKPQVVLIDPQIHLQGGVFGEDVLLNQTVKNLAANEIAHYLDERAISLAIAPPIDGAKAESPTGNDSLKTYITPCIGSARFSQYCANFIREKYGATYGLILDVTEVYNTPISLNTQVSDDSIEHVQTTAAPQAAEVPAEVIHVDDPDRPSILDKAKGVAGIPVIIAGYSAAFFVGMFVTATLPVWGTILAIKKSQKDSEPTKIVSPKPDKPHTGNIEADMSTSTSVSLKDLRSGEVIWSNRITGVDWRDGSAVPGTVRNLMSGFPTLTITPSDQ